MNRLTKILPYIIIVALGAWWLVRTNMSNHPSEEWNAFMKRPVQQLELTTQDAMSGSTKDPVQLIIFSDFECPACSDFALMSKQWKERYAGKINLVFKHYPLSSTCNPGMGYDMHPNACAAAKASQAALNQGKFWEFHDLLFDKPFVAEELPMLALEAGLNLDQFLQDTAKPSTETKIKEDIDLANELEIMGTPSIFINGRQVENPYPEKIEAFIQKILTDEQGELAQVER